jgi:hypothetical protein
MRTHSVNLEKRGFHVTLHQRRCMRSTSVRHEHATACRHQRLRPWQESETTNQMAHVQQWLRARRADASSNGHSEHRTLVTDPDNAGRRLCFKVCWVTGSHKLV